MNSNDEITDEGFVDVPSVIPDLPNDGFVAQKHHSLSRIAKEIVALERKGNEANDDHKRTWNASYKPILEFQIEEMESRSFDLYQRLDTESKIGMEHSLMLSEEFQACKEAIDDVNRRMYCPDANYAFGGSDMGGVFVSFDDFHIEYANGHLFLNLQPGETPVVTLEMMSRGGNGKESVNVNGSSGGAPAGTEHEHGASVHLRLDNFRLRSTKEAGLPNLTFSKLEVQLAVNVAIALKFVAPQTKGKRSKDKGKGGKDKGDKGRRWGSFSSTSSGGSSSKSGGTKRGFRDSFAGMGIGAPGKARGKGTKEGDGKWTTSAADFKIELLSFQGPYGIPRSLVSLILSFAAPLIRDAVVANLPNEFGFFLQSLSSPFTNSGDFSLEGVAFPLFASKLNARENSGVIPTVLGCSLSQIDEFYVMQKRVYGNVPLQKLDDIVTYK